MANLTYPQSSEDPPIYRISFDGVEVGSISQRRQHVQQHDFWHWAADAFSLLSHGGRPPSDEYTFEEALAAFKAAFIDWQATIDPDEFLENLGYMRRGAERWKSVKI